MGAKEALLNSDAGIRANALVHPGGFNFLMNLPEFFQRQFWMISG